MPRLAHEAFGMTSVTPLERSIQGAWSCLTFAGDEPCPSPDTADAAVALDDRLTLALRGRALAAEQQPVLAAFAAQATQVLERQRLCEAAAEAERLAEGNRIRTAVRADTVFGPRLTDGPSTSRKWMGDQDPAGVLVRAVSHSHVAIQNGFESLMKHVGPVCLGTDMHQSGRGVARTRCGCLACGGRRSAAGARSTMR